MTNLAIAANGLRKSYGDKTVLDALDLAVPEGTVFSLLGPNGAGKTTANILSTLAEARMPRSRQNDGCGPRSCRRRSAPRRRRPPHRTPGTRC